MSNNIIYVDGRGATATSIEKLQEMIRKGIVNPCDFTSVTLCYNTHVGVGAPETPEFYPLKFKGNKEELWVSDVTMGYNGEGPHGTKTALMLMGFNFVAEDNEVIFERKILNETFYKSEDDRIEYHYDAMCVTSARLCRIVEESDLCKYALKVFEIEAMSLKWDGRRARNFRKAVSEILTELYYTQAPSTPQVNRLREIAEFPRCCAVEMKRKEKEIAARFSAI